MSVRAAKKSGNYTPTFDLLYTDGLGPTLVDVLSPGPFQHAVVCLAKPVRLFKQPLMPWEILEVQATNNLNVSSALNTSDGKIRPVELPKRGQNETCWLGEAVTKLEPCGQPTLFFHSYFALNAIFREQLSIIDKLDIINQRVFDKQKEYLWKPSILNELRSSVNDAAFGPELSAVNPGNWGAVPLLLEHVDPDLLVGLLSWDARDRLQTEVADWQDFVEETISMCLFDKKKAYEILPLFIARPRQAVLRGAKAPTFADLDSEGQELVLTFPQDQPGQRWPMLPPLLTNNPECDPGAALTHFTSEHCKIIRHALENARSLLSAGKPPHAIVGLTLDELAGQFYEFCFRPVARAWKLKAKGAMEDPGPRAKSRKRPRQKKMTDAELLEFVNNIDLKIKTSADVSRLLPDLRTKLNRFRQTLEQSLTRSDRAVNPLDHDSFIRKMRRQAIAFAEAYEKYTKLMEAHADAD